MNQKAVRIHQFGGTAYSSKVKAAFTFFDEILHLASAAIEPDYLIWFHFQCCDNKGVQTIPCALIPMNPCASALS